MRPLIWYVFLELEVYFVRSVRFSFHDAKDSGIIVRRFELTIAFGETRYHAEIIRPRDGGMEGWMDNEAQRRRDGWNH
jgi:hypothetical protein